MECYKNVIKKIHLGIIIIKKSSCHMYFYEKLKYFHYICANKNIAAWKMLIV